MQPALVLLEALPLTEAHVEERGAEPIVLASLLLLMLQEASLALFLYQWIRVQSTKLPQRHLPALSRSRDVRRRCVSNIRRCSSMFPLIEKFSSPQ